MTVFIYRGTSMYPTLKNLDMLHVQPYEKRKMTQGDVVVFSLPETGRYISHRIVEIKGNEVRTKGDNCNTPDPYLLRPENIFGYVCQVQRQDRYIDIHHGYRGRVTAFRTNVLKQIKLKARGIVYPVYTAMAGSRILTKLFFLFPKMRILSFNRPGGKEFQLIMGKRVIGRRLPGSTEWQIPGYMKLFVDDQSMHNSVEIVK